jgi:hypothetical protein
MPVRDVSWFEVWGLIPELRRSDLARPVVAAPREIEAPSI